MQPLGAENTSKQTKKNKYLFPILHPVKFYRLGRQLIKPFIYIEFRLYVILKFICLNMYMTPFLSNLIWTDLDLYALTSLQYCNHIGNHVRLHNSCCKMIYGPLMFEQRRVLREI